MFFVVSKHYFLQIIDISKFRSNSSKNYFTLLVLSYKKLFLSVTYVDGFDMCKYRAMNSNILWATLELMVGQCRNVMELV